MSLARDHLEARFLACLEVYEASAVRQWTLSVVTVKKDKVDADPILFLSDNLTGASIDEDSHSNAEVPDQTFFQYTNPELDLVRNRRSGLLDVQVTFTASVGSRRALMRPNKPGGTSGSTATAGDEMRYVPFTLEFTNTGTTLRPTPASRRALAQLDDEGVLKPSTTNRPPPEPSNE